MTYLVQIKPDCPRDSYSRNSIRFTKHTPVRVVEAELTEEIRTDPFLDVRPVPAEKPATKGQ